MAMVDVDGSILLMDSQLSLVDLDWGLVSIWFSVCIHQMISVTSGNDIAVLHT